MKALRVILLSGLILGAHLHALAQGTAFSYQGSVTSNGSPANGNYDLTFAVYLTNSGGTAWAGPLTNSGVGVTNGLFTTLVDFGPGVFTGASNWLEIGVRPSGPGSFNVLAPRELIASTPYAIQAANAASVTGLSVQQNTSGGPNLLGSATVNFISPNVIGGTIGGGGAANFSGSAYSNSVFANFGTIGGGAGNGVGGAYSVIGGGFGNTVNSMSQDSTIAGGLDNIVGGLGSDTVGATFTGRKSASYEHSVRCPQVSAASCVTAPRFPEVLPWPMLKLQALAEVAV